VTFEEFLAAMTKQFYVWRMASHSTNSSAPARLKNTRRRIDDLVLSRALVVIEERRCAAVWTSSPDPARGGRTYTVRCEYHRGHAPVLGRQTSAGGLGMHDRRFDHGDDPMAQAGAERRPELSDLLLGAVRTLVGEGWTEDQARALVLATYLRTAQ
jgi:hypothetical protein